VCILLVLITYIYCTLQQTQIYHTLGPSVLGMYINCEILSWLNKQSNNQQGNMTRDSLVITVVFTSRVGLVTGVMGLRYTVRNQNFAGAEIFSSSQSRCGSCLPPPPSQDKNMINIIIEGKYGKAS
jgi:hypothetical protein